MRGPIWRSGRACRPCVSFARLSNVSGYIGTYSLLCHKSTSTWLSRSSRNYKSLSPESVTTTIRKSPVHALLKADILEECKSRGIGSFAELGFQAQFQTTLPRGGQIVDEPQHRHDMRLWLLLLHYGVITSGPKVLPRMIHSMTHRYGRVQLTGDDQATLQLWDYILDIAVRHRLTNVFLALCDRKGPAWDRPLLFSDLVAPLMRQNLSEAIAVSHRLASRSHPSSLNSQALFCAFDPCTEQDLHTMITVYDALRLSSLYDGAMQHLLSRSRPNLLLRLHNLLLDRGDFPSSIQLLLSVAENLARAHQPLDKFLQKLQQKGFHVSPEISAIYSAIMNHSGRTDHIRQTNSVSDSFAAKVFATKSLSFRFVLSSLKTIGLLEIGPQSLREIGLASKDLDEFRERLDTVDQHEIGIQISTYSQVLLVLTKRKRDYLARQILETDMHHSVFDDPHTLCKLLHEHLRRQEWKQVNLICTILNKGNTDRLSSFVTSQINACVVEGNPRSVLGRTLAAGTFESRSDTLGWTGAIDLCLSRLKALPVRKHRTPETDLVTPRTRNYTLLVIGLMQDARAAGVTITLRQWRQVLRYILLPSCHQESYVFLRWLANDLVYGEDLTGGKHLQSTVQLNNVFDGKFQALFLKSSLDVSSFTKKSYGLSMWKQAMDLLKHLRDRHSLDIDSALLERTLVAQSISLMPVGPDGLDLRYLRLSHRFLGEALSYWWAICGAKEQCRKKSWAEVSRTFRVLLQDARTSRRSGDPLGKRDGLRFTRQYVNVLSRRQKMLRSEDGGQ